VGRTCHSINGGTVESTSTVLLRTYPARKALLIYRTGQGGRDRAGYGVDRWRRKSAALGSKPQFS